MMKRYKVNTDFTEFRDNELPVLAGKIISAIEEHVAFENIEPPIVAMRALLEDYIEKQEISMNGGSILENTLKRASRQRLCKTLKVWANYVNMVADGDLTILTSSAMILRKQPTASVVPGMVEMMRLKDGATSGELLLSFKAQKGVTFFEVQVGQMMDGDIGVRWDEPFIVHSSRNNPIRRLKPGLRYFVRMRAHNRAGFGDWNEPISMIAR